MIAVTVHPGTQSYPILIGETYAALPGALRRAGLGPRLAIVTNRSVLRHVGRALMHQLARAGFTCQVALLPDTERAKSAAWALRLTTTVITQWRGEPPVILALGGGVVGDTAGFVASILRRGVPYVQIPTTLLAQVDSAIGGKVAIDLPAGKNLVGAFHQPRLVFSNVAALRSLSLRQRRSGLAEVVKYGVMADASLFRYVERHVDGALRAQPSVLRVLVERCSRIKARMVSHDEREARGVRTLLNFGHTIGHALEAATGYSDRYTHGEAIAIGMLVAGEIAVVLGRWRRTDLARLEALLTRLGLPTRARGIAAARVVARMRYDKKRVDGTMRWVLPTRIGRAVVATDVPDAVIRRAAARYVQRSPA